MAELKMRLEVCKERNNYFRKHGPRYQKKHLLKRVELAREKGRDEAATKILAIQWEYGESFWRKINYTCGKVKGGSPTSAIQLPKNGSNDQVDKHTNQATFHKAIWASIHYKRLYLAEETPICQGRLCADFGYNAAT